MNNTRAALLTGASTVLIATMGASSALAQSISEVSSNSLSVVQNFNDFTTPAPNVALDGNTDGSIFVVIENNDPADYALQNSTVTVGSSAAASNSTSATGYANTADLTVNADLNNVVGSGFSAETASYDGAGDGASVTGATDIGIALVQQNINATAAISDSTGLGIDIDNGATGSTARIAGNSNSATGVLNSGVTLIDASANNSSGSAGIGSSQASVDSSLTASISSLAAFGTGSGTSGVALDNSVVELIGNSQVATAVANSASNTQRVDGNDLVLAGNSAGQAQAGDLAGANAFGGYATASLQQLAGDNAAGVTAAVDTATGGYVASITGDVVGSTLSNDGNSARALARGNEVVNATTLDANSVTTPSAGTVAATASQQDIIGTVAITASVADGPAILNAVDGDVEVSSAVTASGNVVVADAAGNRGSNTIKASATTIATADAADLTSGTAVNTGPLATADAAFAVANTQSVSSDTTITAGLVDDATAPTAGTSVRTAISGSVTDSSVVSEDNQLAAFVSGNTTLTGGNAVTLDGTNVATNAAVANVQTMAGALRSTIGSEGTDPVPPTTENFTFMGSSTGSDGNFTFTGTTAGTEAQYLLLVALNTNPNLTYSYDAGQITVVATNQASSMTTFEAGYTTSGSAGTPATGGVIVTVGNDITNSSVAVNGNATTGSAIGNSAANSVAATATNLDSARVVTAASAGTDATGIAATADLTVANTQAVDAAASATSTVGAVFAVSAEGVASPDLSDVSASTVSVANNTADSTVKGNAADNAVTQSATNLSNTSALVNGQQMDGTLTADIADFSGAFAVIGRDVTSSSVLVDGNAFSGSTTGNDATNTVSVNGSSTLAAGDDTVGATADPSNGVVDPVALARADHALANLQALGAGASLATDVVAGYGITTLGGGAPTSDDDTSDVVASTLSVSNNAQSATTTGNQAANAVNVSGGAIQTNAALLSVQTSDAASTSASSVMSVAAPAANTGSTLALDGNANSATATVNTATNAMTVDAGTHLASTTVDAGPPATEGSNAVLGGSALDDYAVTADFAVNNFQVVNDGAVVNANATTTVLNTEGGVPPLGTDGIQQSTVDVNGNSTRASASSNQAVNSLALSANSATASGGVLNQQSSGAAVTANALTMAGVNVAGSDTGVADPSPVDTSAVTVAGNSTVARAGGNNATNTLSATATTFANDSAGGTTTLNADRTDAVGASFAVLNEQANSGPIIATASAIHSATFAIEGTAPSATNSSVAVRGNSVGSVAYGNAATNELTFAALNSPATGGVPTTTAIASNQVNSGNVAALTTANNVSIAMTAADASSGPVSQSSLSITGNALSAAAYGNSATNTLVIGGNNVNVTFTP